MASEYRIMLKTHSANFRSIERFIKKEHNYSTPEIIKIDITDGSEEYLNWLKGAAAHDLEQPTSS